MQVTHKQRQAIVFKFLKLPINNWPNEIKMAKQLIKTQEDFEFFFNLDLGFKLNSLAYFKTDDGKQKLEEIKKNDENLKNLDFAPKTEYIIDNKKHGQDIVVEKKKKNSIFEFLEDE